MAKDRRPNGACAPHDADRRRAALLREALLPADHCQRLASTFKMLADPTRVRIIGALAKDEFCVCDLSHALLVTPSAVSHQLKLLRLAGLVRFRREGRRLHYSLDDEHVRRLFEQGRDHARHRQRGAGRGAGGARKTPERTR